MTSVTDRQKFLATDADRRTHIIEAKDLESIFIILSTVKDDKITKSSEFKLEIMIQLLFHIGNKRSCLTKSIPN